MFREPSLAETRFATSIAWLASTPAKSPPGSMTMRAIASVSSTAAKLRRFGIVRSSHAHGAWNATAMMIAHAMAPRNGESTR